MPKRKRELDPELVHRTVRELKEILPRHRVKDPKRVAAGKAAWAKLPQEEKDRRLALLRAGREARTGPARREKKGRRNVFEQSLYEVHKNLVERGYSKKEVKQSI
ncbi:hypothetical protein KAW18_18230, partial [candidate division WOR-3 bacterium]|nr:hypothetical protein [candidate division WOR-3 bacterium]